jgi:hypothetical protein
MLTASNVRQNVILYHFNQFDSHMSQPFVFLRWSYDKNQQCSNVSWMLKTKRSSPIGSAFRVEGFVPFALGVMPTSPVPICALWTLGVGEMGCEMGVSVQNDVKGT